MTFSSKLTFSLCALLGGLFTAHLPLSADVTQDAEANAVLQAYKHFESGQPELALEGFNKALEMDATNITAQLGRAMIFQEQQRHEEAFSSYDLIVQKHPEHAYAWNGRGLAAFNLQDFDEALSSFEQATADQPVNGFFYESLAWTHLCRGDYSAAAVSAKQATLMYNQCGEIPSYPLLIAYFSQLKVGKSAEAARTLKYAQSNKPAGGAWPAPVFDYLAGGLTQTELISYVTNKAQETEAHTYIGLNLQAKGKIESAEHHLNWVAEKGDQRVFEQMLARILQVSNKVALLAQ